MVSLGR